ncbi:MAG TPA: SDR family NAD(P)-dependent oxidoreductase [Acidimicrobiia bacterium]
MNAAGGWAVTGRTCVVTGASTGIGRETVRALSSLGANLVLVGRSAERHRGVLDDLARSAGAVAFIETELGDLGSVRSAAERVRKDHPDTTVLINNAGQGGHRGMTAQGFELAFGVNYLSHFLLTSLLLPLLDRNGPSRVVNVSSDAHYRIKRFDPAAALGRTRTLTGIDEYCFSKAAIAAMTLELAHRFDPGRVTAVAVHPGTVATDGWRAIPQPLRWLVTRSMMSPAQGSLTVIRAVTEPSLQSGLYLTPNGSRPVHHLLGDPAVTSDLWEQSERWVAEFR